MASFTVSTRTTTTAALAAADTLFVAQLGSIFVNNINQAAITGQGNNPIVIDGNVYSGQDIGINLVGPGNAVLVDASGYVAALNNAIFFDNAGAAGPGVVYNYGQIISSQAHAIGATRPGSTIKLFAGSTTIGNDIGIELNTNGNVNNAGLLEATGGFGSAIMANGGGNTVINSGTIFGRTNAFFGANVAGLNLLVNSGIMRSLGGGAVGSNSSMNIVNSGTIDSGISIAISVNTGVLNLLNSGYVFGRSYIGVQGDNGSVNADTVINNGFIQGDQIAVDLGQGNDFFDGRNGLQFGQVLGGDGNDALFGGAGNDMLFGGNGDDQLMGNGAGDLLDGGGGNDYARYDGGGAVTASLATPGANAGDAAGDTYSSIEGLIGSNAGDLLIGDVNANTLFGLGGADGIAGGDGNDTIYGGDGGDSIAGQNGNDIIYGQAGGDVLSGGAGTDLFVYTALSDGGDYISDWNVNGTLDRIDLRPLFDVLGYAGMTPRQDGILVVAQNGADTDISVNGTFMVRLGNTNAATVTDANSFFFQ